MSAKSWAKFTNPSKSFDYAGDKLKKSWPRLHRGDCEEFPSAKSLATMAGENPAMSASIKGFKGDFEGLAASLQDAWRAFHRGDFGLSAELGSSAGLFGAVVMCKATGIYATYLEPDSAKKQALFKQAADAAEALAKALPECANAHYFKAFALGRYSQCISIGKALAQGLGGKIKESLDTTLKLEPKHADAHLALGLYHAEIINKVGSMVGGLTYGAKATTGVSLLEKAIALNPDSPVAQLEYGNALGMMFGEKREADIIKAYTKAAEMKPADAMESLDIDAAKAQFE
jgi:tetratricopeptide (TPR) repeat protein